MELGAFSLGAVPLGAGSGENALTVLVPLADMVLTAFLSLTVVGDVDPRTASCGIDLGVNVPTIDPGASSTIDVKVC